MEILKKYIRNIAIALDQLLNAVCFGDPDETISSRLGRNYDGSKLELFVNWIFSWKQEDHCSDSVERDEGSQSIFK